jgi:NAD(P)-dependent dehydrogenase (short-subunit alcohol dehydrogenase family)
MGASPSKTKDFYAGKHVLITGGSEGLGLSIAKLVAERGSRVTLVARTLKKLEAARDAVAQHAGRPADDCVCVASADVTQEAQVVAAVAAGVARFGAVDVLVTSAGQATCGALGFLVLLLLSSCAAYFMCACVCARAGVSCTKSCSSPKQTPKQTPTKPKPKGYFHAMPTALFEQHMALNYMGALHAVRAVYGAMVGRDAGSIVIVASTLALLGARVCCVFAVCCVLCARCVCAGVAAGVVSAACVVCVLCAPHPNQHTHT